MSAPDSMDTAALQARLEQAVALHKQGRLAEARSLYEELARALPQHHVILNLLGTVAHQLRDFTAALAAFDAALAVAPGNASYHAGRGVALKSLGRLDEAADAYGRATELAPDFHGALHNRGNLLADLGRREEALECYRRAFAQKPDYDFLPGQMLYMRLGLCDWSDLAGELAQIRAGVASGQPVSMCLPLLAAEDAPAFHREAATLVARRKYPASTALGPLPPRPPGERIRIGYFSSDFVDHPVAQLSAGLFEQHDRRRFEVFAFSGRAAPGDALQQRLMRGFDHFIDVSGDADIGVARRARELGIDIAVDLGGYTKDSRAGILGYRAAPLQVSYLGYPGTSGADYIDYMIVDPWVVDAGTRPHFSERLVTLPWYLVNDRACKDMADAQAYARPEWGLPAAGFVFACLNSNFKMTPAVFERWMRILAAVPGSVLFLLAEHPTARRNLVREAEARGIAGERLVFGTRQQRPRYLARFRAIDLFLDTFPYGAHTVASDALWMGVPVVTCTGQSFASRVGASLLRTVGVPELITTKLDEYERLAIALAQQPAQLQALRTKLAAQRDRTPLFDAAQFARRLEAAFLVMQARHRQGLPPADFSVAE